MLGFTAPGFTAREFSLGFRVQGPGFRVQGSGFRVIGFRVQGSGFRVQGYRVQGLGFRNRGGWGGIEHRIDQGIQGVWAADADCAQALALGISYGC